MQHHQIPKPHGTHLGILITRFPLPFYHSPHHHGQHGPTRLDVRSKQPLRGIRDTLGERINPRYKYESLEGRCRTLRQVEVGENVITLSACQPNLLADPVLRLDGLHNLRLEGPCVIAIVAQQRAEGRIIDCRIRRRSLVQVDPHCTLITQGIRRVAHAAESDRRRREEVREGSQSSEHVQGIFPGASRYEMPATHLVERPLLDVPSHTVRTEWAEAEGVRVHRRRTAAAKVRPGANQFARPHPPPRHH